MEFFLILYQFWINFVCFSLFLKIKQNLRNLNVLYEDCHWPTVVLSTGLAIGYTLNRTFINLDRLIVLKSRGEQQSITVMIRDAQTPAWIHYNAPPQISIISQLLQRFLMWLFAVYSWCINHRPQGNLTVQRRVVDSRYYVSYFDLISSV